MIPPCVEVPLVLLAQLTGEDVELALDARLGVPVVVGVDRLHARAGRGEDRRVHVGGVQPLPEQEPPADGGGQAEQREHQGEGGQPAAGRRGGTGRGRRPAGARGARPGGRGGAPRGGRD